MEVNIVIPDNFLSVARRGGKNIGSGSVSKYNNNNIGQRFLLDQISADDVYAMLYLLIIMLVWYLYITRQ